MKLLIEKFTSWHRFCLLTSSTYFYYENFVHVVSPVLCMWFFVEIWPFGFHHFFYTFASLPFSFFLLCFDENNIFSIIYTVAIILSWRYCFLVPFLEFWRYQLVFSFSYLTLSTRLSLVPDDIGFDFLTLPTCLLYPYLAITDLL